MDSAALPFALLLLIAIIAAAVIGVRLYARRREAAPNRIRAEEAQNMLSVMDAAAAAYAAAKREGMTIAWVAENATDSADPVDWFARSIAAVLTAYFKSGSDFEKVQGVGSAPQSLYIRKRDYKTYLDWARGMQ